MCSLTRLNYSYWVFILRTICYCWTFNPSPAQELPLALVYGKADKLLNALLVLLLSGAAAGVLTWMSEGAVRLAHFLVHPSQPQPDTKTNGQMVKKCTMH